MGGRAGGSMLLLGWVGGARLKLRRSNRNWDEISFWKNESVAGGTPGGVEVHVHCR